MEKEMEETDPGGAETGEQRRPPAQGTWDGNTSQVGNRAGMRAECGPVSCCAQLNRLSKEHEDGERCRVWLYNVSLCKGRLCTWDLLCFYSAFRIPELVSLTAIQKPPVQHTELASIN